MNPSPPLYILIVRWRRGGRWFPVTGTPADWSAMNVWVAYNYGAWHPALYERKLWPAGKPLSDADAERSAA